MPSVVKVPQVLKQKDLAREVVKKRNVTHVNLPVYVSGPKKTHVIQCTACGRKEEVPIYRKCLCNRCFGCNGIAENIIDCVNQGKLATYTREHNAREWDQSEIFYS